jgi:hypothetical protein
MKRLIAVAAFLAAFAAHAQSSVPVAGKDYVEIPNGTPLDPGEGQVVVGRYLVRGGSIDGIFRIASALIEREHAAGPLSAR